MNTFFSTLAGAVGLYLVVVIGAAGLAVPVGGLKIGSFKLINPAMAFLVALAARAFTLRRRDPGAGAASAPAGASAPAASAPAASAPGAGSALARLALLWLAVTVPLTALAWARGLDGGFIREDFHRLERVMAGAPWNGMIWRDAGINTYWSRQVSLALDAATLPVFGLEPTGWHAVNLAIHLVVALLAGALLLALTGELAAAALATTLFALCPMAVEPVCWIAARDDSLAALFALLAALALVRAVRTAAATRDHTPSRDRAATARGFAWTAASVAATALALFCKESALPLPAALAIIVWLATPRGDGAGRGGELRVAAGALARVLPHLLLVGVYLTIRGRQLAAQGWAPGDTFTDWPKMLLLPLSPAAPLAFPINMHVLGELAPAARFIVGAALALGAAAALWRREPLCERRTVGLYLVLLAFTVPVYRMIHLSATLQNNRYLYLPAVPFAMLAAHLLVQNAGAWRGRARLAIPLVVAACFALCRVNAEPWVAAGAVANRLRQDLAPLPAALRQHESVRLAGLPDQYRGAFLFNLSDATGPLVVFHGLDPDLRFRLFETYHADSKPRPRAPGEPEFRWRAGQGLIAVPEESNSVSTRSLSAAAVNPLADSGSATTR